MSFLLIDSYIRLIISIVVFITYILTFNNKLFEFNIIRQILFYILEIYFLDDIVFKFLYFYEESEKYLNGDYENYNLID